MARQFSLIYQIPPVALLPPAADAAGRTSAFRDLRNALKAYVVAHINQGNVAPVTLTVLQAQDVNGTNSKALLAATPIFLNAATATSDALVSQTAALSFATSTTLADKLIVFEIVPEACMDVGNGFKTLAISTSASNAANITQATLFLLNATQAASAPTTYA